jgi:thiol-disulfide isomerase/thioredoxin
MTRLLPIPTLIVTCLAASGTSVGAALIEVAPTGQFQVQDARVYRSVEPPPKFLVLGSRFGRPVLITTGPLGARLLDPGRVQTDAPPAETVRVDTGGSQQDFLTVRMDGENLVLERDGTTMKMTASPPILGDKSLDEMLAAMPDYRRSAARYTPNAAALDRIRRAKQPAELLVFFGSWCSHCEQMIPRLVRVLQDTRGAALRVVFHGVPAPGGPQDPMADTLGVRGLPTGIFRRDGKEVGRLEGPEWNAPETTLADLVDGR